MHIENLQKEMEMQRREMTGQFTDVVKDLTHKLEVFKAQQMQPIGVVTTKGAELDAELKGMANKITQVEDRAAKPKKRLIKFIDDDTAEMVDQEDIS